MSNNLQVNDPVTVKSHDGKELEGIVAYTGPVEFAATDSIGTTNTDDWVGIRLTGKSLGRGKNNGTVKGKQYFECPESCGIFVHANAVVPRKLTRLEELRLRRELASSATGGTAATTAATTSAAQQQQRTPPRTAVKATKGSPDSSKMTPPAASAAANATDNRTKLEELRQKRAALKAKQEGGGSTGTTTSTSPRRTPLRTTTSSSSSSASKAAAEINVQQQAELEDLKKQVETLTKAMEEKSSEATSLADKVQAADAQINDQKAKIAELQNNLLDAAAREEEQIAKQQQQQDTAAPTPTKALLAKSIEDAQEENLNLQSTNAELTEKLQDALQNATNLQRQFDEEKKNHATALEDLTRARSEATLYQNQLQAINEQSEQKGASDAVHYKERAKLQADAMALKRKIEQMEKEKLELESTIEDITLDKEQLQEEKETLEDRYEEIKLDAETAQMETEELKMELEDARATAERVTEAAETLTTAAVVASATGDTSSSTPTKQQQQQDGQEEVVQALQVQNARLREALIRLREQSALEKMELTRQLRTVEKDAVANNDVKEELENLRQLKSNLEEQISDLKDMVEQGSAFESMVEDLSDRLMGLEEENVALQGIVREMEEAAELTAEMEEVQQEELKALSLDLEGRDTIIRNLEEAIKMQRRREEDFRRSVGNYRTTVETLKQEKKALLELQQGGEGEKSSLISSSQKALSRAAQLVADAADLRKREAQAAVDNIDKVVFKHQSARMESLLPHSVVSAEVSAIKGELMTSKVVAKAAKTLEGIGASMRKAMRPPLTAAADQQDANLSSGPLNVNLSDEVQQQVSTMFHQTEFAHSIAGASSDLLRYLIAGQWPELLSQEASTELGAMLGHTVVDIDNTFGLLLKSLKEEGSLIVEQSSIGELQLAINTTMQSLRADLEREDGEIVPPTWNPPGWKLLKDACAAKFSCLGAASALSLVVESLSETGTIRPAANGLFSKVEQCSSQATNAYLRLFKLDIKNQKLVDELSSSFEELATESMSLFTAIKDLLLNSGDVQACEETTNTALRRLAKLAAVLRGENLNPTEDESCHLLSPETEDPWNGIASVACAIRGIDGDSEDVNYLLRAHAIEHQLGDAVENEPKLALANSKVASLEKTLSSRSKEIAMQNARLSELEKIVAKSNTSPIGRGKNFDFASSEEYNALKEENRVLTEAMDVMQREVEMYENEIRALKDFKSPGKRGGGHRAPRRAVTSADLVPRPVVDDAQSPSALEATLFRPALQEALEEAARWKSSAVADAIKNLPPLPVFSKAVPTDGTAEGFIRINSAIAACRIQKAKITMVDLTNTTKPPRVQLREMKAKRAAANERLESVLLRCRGIVQS